MGFRQHVRDNRLAISSGLLGLLAIGTAIWRPRDQPQSPAVPRPVAPAVRPPGPPFQVRIQAVSADPGRGVAALDQVAVVVANNGERVTAYFVAREPDGGAEPIRRAVRAAWDGIRSQLPADARPTVHVVVLRTRPKTLSGEPPTAGDPGVVAHAVVRPAEAGGWPAAVGEWR